MIGYIAALWAIALAGGFLPSLVARIGKQEQTGHATPWVSVLNVLSGGVFLAAGFMHLLPQAQEGLARLSAEWHFELAFFFASLGFVLIFLFEDLVEYVSRHGNPCLAARYRAHVLVSPASVREGFDVDSGEHENELTDEHVDEQVVHTEFQLRDDGDSAGRVGVLSKGTNGDGLKDQGGSRTSNRSSLTSSSRNSVRGVVSPLYSDHAEEGKGSPQSSSGLYGAIDSSAGGRSIESGWRGADGLTDEESQAAEPVEVLDPASPIKDGHGPWIGRRLHSGEAAATDSDDRVSKSVVASLAEKHHGCRTPIYDERGTSIAKMSTSDAYSSRLGLILGAVLSFHAVMEGLGLGASSASRAPGIFAAIVVHKGLAAFSLGCILFSSDAPRSQYVVMMAVFSVLTPVGAIAGMMVRASVGGTVGAGVCTALGAGTFIHVAAMEILPRDLIHDDRKKSVKLTCLMVGYLTFAGLSRIV